MMQDDRECLLSPDKQEPSPACEEMDADNVFEKSVPFGKFQICLQIAVTSLMLLLAYQEAFLYFIGYNPPWTCISKSSSNFCNSNFGKEIKAGNINFTARCQLGRAEWKYTWKKQYSYVTEFDLVCTKSLMASIVGGIFCVGSAFGGFVNGLVADIYGRKPILSVTLILTVCVSVASSYVSQIWQLIVLRLLNGAVLAACLNTSVVMMSEFVITRHRPISFSICLLAICVSTLLSDMVAYFEKDWRKLQLYCSLPSLLLLFVFPFLPESPRWLLSAGKVVKAEKVFKRVADINGKPLLILKLKSPSISTDKKLSSKKYTYFDLLKNPKVVIMILILGFMWLTCGLTMFTSTLVMSDIGSNIYGNFAIAVAIAIPTYLITMYVCKRFGRKRTTLIPMLLAGIMSGIISTLLKLKKGDPLLMVTLTVALKCFINTAFNSLYLWTFELYPTVVRLQGLAFAAFMMQLGNACAPFLTGVLESVNVALPFLIMFILTVISALFGTSLLETKNLPTRENFVDLFKACKSINSKDVDVKSL